VVAIQKADESGCRFGPWRHGHRLVRDQWPVAGHIFHSLMKHSIIVRLLWQWFWPQTKQHQIVITRNFILA